MRVPRAVALGEELADDRFTGERAEGDGGDEFLSRRGDNHLNLSAPLYQTTDDETGLIGRNAARYSEYYLLSFKHLS